MNQPGLTISSLITRKWIVVIVLSLSAVGAFATLGDGKKRSSSTSTKGFLSSRTSVQGTFSLKSGYAFRGSQPINTETKYFSLNTVVNLKKGNTTYVLPLKKRVLISNIKLDLGNRQFSR